MKTRLTAAVVLMLSLLLTACSGAGSGGGKSFKCGSQGFAEVEIICELAKLAVEGNTDHRVEHVMGLGSALASLEATKAGDLDMAVGYTGTLMLGLYETAVTPAHYDPAVAHRFVQERMLADHGIWLMEPFGFNNTYALIMRRDRAQEMGITKTSDLAPHAAAMRLGTDNTWQNYPGQGYDQWQELYGFRFGSAPEMDYGLMFRATASGDVDAAMAYATDGRIQQLDLVVIEDDKNFNPPYHGVLMISDKLRQENPEVYEVLKQLEGQIDTTEMTRLNAEVDVHEKEPREVAQQWLKAKRLIE